MARYKELPQLETPEDKSITTLYIGNVVDLSEEQLRYDQQLKSKPSSFPSSFLFIFSRDHFYQFGEIRSITVVPKQSCAFVQFTQRDAAERAAKESFNQLIIEGKRLTVKWGKPAAIQGSSLRPGESLGFESNYEPVPGLPNGKIILRY